MTVREQNIHLPLEQIHAFCRRHPIQKLSLFGSALTSDFSPDSDIDLLVEFTPHSRISYFDLIDMQSELTSMLRRQVDLRTPKELHPRFREQVIHNAEALYARN